jgi:predicted Zn-dependent protease with MMP-like domain
MSSQDPINAWAMKIAPSLDDLAALGQSAFDALPAKFRDHVGDIVFRVADFADHEVLDSLGIEDPFELSGLYHGVDLTHRSVLEPGGASAIIFLYRRPLLDEWAERGDIHLGDLVAHVLVHEIGHHFGLSDDDIAAIEGSD